MDPFINLPLECLQQIIRIFDDNNDAATMTSLLRVNKYFAAVTLPFVYSAPFRDSFHCRPRPEGGQTNPAVSNRRLTRVLLGRVFAASEGTVSLDDPAIRLLSIAFQIDFPAHSANANNNIKKKKNRKATKALSLDYLAHIHKLGRGVLCPGKYGSFSAFRFKLDDYIQGDEFANLAQLDLSPPTYPDSVRDKNQFRCSILPALLTAAVHWTLAFPIFEQLQVMTVPISNIGRYLDHIGRMGSLRKVFVCMDRVFEYGHRGGLEGEDQAHVAAWDAAMNATMDKLVQFFREHSRIFPGCLQSVEYYPGGIGKGYFQQCPEQVQDRIVQFLPPLHQPRSLDKSNWNRFFAHPKATDLCRVERIETGAPIGRMFGLIRKEREFLQKCRVLRRLDMACLGKGAFQWAVREKKDMEQLLIIDIDSHDDNTNRKRATWDEQDKDRPLNLNHGLVPVSEVIISNVNSHTDELDDILYAFSGTLKTLTVNIVTDSSLLAYIGHRWLNSAIHFPALAYLTIMTWNRLVIDRHLFTRCPNLISVYISDNKTTSYQSQNTVPCLPARLAKLESLELLGWTSLTFHPDTLYSTASLMSLTIDTPCGRSIYFYIPPGEELNASYILPASDHGEDNDDLGTGTGTGTGATTTTAAMTVRPSWKWDWHLPHLTSLKLSGEFAYRFQFRMLQGCPALRSMDLSMLTQFGLETRLLTIDGDLSVEKSSSPLSSSDSFSPRTSTTTPRPLRRERIVAPNLEMLAMRGAWSIDDAVMVEFLGKEMFPCLKKVSADGWIGFSWSGLANALRVRELSFIPTTPPSSFSSPTSTTKSGTSSTATATIAAATAAIAQQTTDNTLKEVRFESEFPTNEALLDAGMMDSTSFCKRKNEDFLGVMVQLQGLYSVLKVPPETDEL